MQLDHPLMPLALACLPEAAHVTSASQTMAAPAMQRLVDAIRGSDSRFAFEREGRTEAIAAIREALPAMERDLFDAVVDDHACEISALTQALFLILRAVPSPPT